MVVVVGWWVFTVIFVSNLQLLLDLGYVVVELGFWHYSNKITLKKHFCKIYFNGVVEKSLNMKHRVASPPIEVVPKAQVLMFLIQHNWTLFIIQHNQTLFIIQHNKTLFIIQHNKTLFITQHNKTLFIIQHNKTLIHLKTNSPCPDWLRLECWPNFLRVKCIPESRF